MSSSFLLCRMEWIVVKLTDVEKPLGVRRREKKKEKPWKGTRYKYLVVVILSHSRWYIECIINYRDLELKGKVRYGNKRLRVTGVFPLDYTAWFWLYILFHLKKTEVCLMELEEKEKCLKVHWKILFIKRTGFADKIWFWP